MENYFCICSRASQVNSTQSRHDSTGALNNSKKRSNNAMKDPIPHYLYPYKSKIISVIDVCSCSAHTISLSHIVSYQIMIIQPRRLKYFMSGMSMRKRTLTIQRSSSKHGFKPYCEQNQRLRLRLNRGTIYFKQAAVEKQTLWTLKLSAQQQRLFQFNGKYEIIQNTCIIISYHIVQ